MSSALRTIAAIHFWQPVWSASRPCAMICGYPQHLRNYHSLANVEDLGSHATEKRM
jgi:hypothetical protein